MKRFFLFLLVLIALGALVGRQIAEDPGYVLLVYNQFSLETSLWFALAVLVLAFVAVYAALTLALGLFGLGGRWRGWRQRRRARKTLDQTAQGLLRCAEGDWAQAESLLSDHAKESETPLVNYLAAAHCAHERHEDTERDRYLSWADAHSGRSHASELMRARFHYQRGEYKQCLDILTRLRQAAPRNPYVLELMYRTYRALGDWNGIHALLGELRKHQVLATKALDELEVTTHRELLAQALRFSQLGQREQALDRLKREWRALPKALKRDPSLIQRYAQGLAQLGRGADAEPLLREALNRDWEPELVRLYGRLQGPDPQKQLASARHWQKEHPHDPDLLMTLGRLNLQCQQWEEARLSFEASARLKPAPEAHAELARLMDQLDKPQESMEHYRRALEAQLSELPELPLPAHRTAP